RERGVGGREHGERAGTLERVDQASGLERRGQGVELAGRHGGIDDIGLGAGVGAGCLRGLAGEGHGAGQAQDEGGGQHTQQLRAVGTGVAGHGRLRWYWGTCPVLGRRRYPHVQPGHVQAMYIACPSLRCMYPVKVASTLTGLTPETLRAWERRHAAVVPHREGGRRLYDAAMIERLARLHRLTARGHPIRDLAPLDDAALDALLEQSRQTGYGALETLPERMLDAVADYRVDQFDRELSVAIATLPVPILVTRVVMPLLREVGVRWADGRLAIAQERLVSSLLRARLLSILNQHPREQRPRILFATLPGEPHELGLLGAALLAHEAEAPVLYLGTELPAAELLRVVERLDASAVALSSIDPGQARAALAELRLLHAGLPDEVPVWLGGANARYLAEALGADRVCAVNDPATLAQLVRRRTGRRR